MPNVSFALATGRLAAGLVIAWMLAAGAAFAQAGDPAPVQTLRVTLDAGSRDHVQTGLVITPGHVVTADTGYSQRRNEAFALVNGDRVALEPLLHDEARRLVIWSIAADGLSAPVFASDVADEGEAVGLEFMGAAGPVRLEGRVTESDAARPGIYFDGARGFEAFGGALVNGCGEVMGMNLPGPDYGTRELRREDGLGRAGTVASMNTIKAALELAGVGVTTAPAACLSEVERAREDVEQARERITEQETETEELRSKAAEAAARAAELEARAKQLEEAAAEGRAEAEQQARAARREAEQARAAAEDAAGALADAETELAELDEALADAEAELGETRRQLDETEKTLDETEASLESWKIYAAGAGGLAVLAMLGGGLFAWHRSRQLGRARAAASEAMAEAERMAAMPRAVPAVADALLENDERSLLLSGKLLPEAAGGVTVGRNPQLAQTLVEAEDISREHARFREIDGRVYVEDLGSSFGTRLNGHDLVPGELNEVAPGDEVALASHSFKFRRTV